LTSYGEFRWLRPLILMTALIPMACTFEHRENGEDPGEGPVAVDTGQVLEDPPEADPTRGALHTLRAFREAMAVGDLSLALALLDREATLLDDLVGDPALAGSRGEALLELRARLAEGIRLEEDSTRVSFPGDVAVVITRLHLQVQEDAPEVWQERAGSHLHETVVLVPTEEGWRIRHLHRSILPRP
jgi:hypothetical protein